MKDWFTDTFMKQVNLQEHRKCTNYDAELPDPIDMYGSATGMIIEIGEMLQCDTRWKKAVTGSPKEPVYNREQFVEEMADVFIYLLNTAIYSGISIDELKKQIENKQNIVRRRFGLQ